MHSRESLLASFCILHPEEGRLVRLKNKNPTGAEYKLYNSPGFWCHYCKIRPALKDQYRQRLLYCWLCEFNASKAGLGVEEYHERRLEKAEAQFEDYVKEREEKGMVVE
jgi:hypothetical protein